MILQPSYLPWLGYFDQIARSDVFVFYDDVQYDKHGWRNRNRIKTADGWQWLTVPVARGFGQLICDTRIDNSKNWAESHMKALRTNYSRASFFPDYAGRLEDIYSKKWELLEQLNVAIVREVCGILGIDRKFIFSKDMGISGQRSERLIKICQTVGAREYLSGDAARSYLDERAFDEAGIKVEFQNYKHPEYPQLFGEFIPYLSAVDLLFNCGPDSHRVLESTARQEKASQDSA